MQRHKHRPRLTRQDRPARTPGQGWRIGPASQEANSEPGARIDLTFPITVNGVERAVVNLRAPTARDLVWYRGLRGTDRFRLFSMAGRLSGLTTVEIDELDVADAEAMAAACKTMIEGV